MLKNNWNYDKFIIADAIWLEEEIKVTTCCSPDHKTQGELLVYATKVVSCIWYFRVMTDLRSCNAAACGRAGRACSSRGHGPAWRGILAAGLCSGASEAGDQWPRPLGATPGPRCPRPRKPGWRCPVQARATGRGRTLRPAGRCSWGWQEVPESIISLIHVRLVDHHDTQCIYKQCKHNQSCFWLYLTGRFLDWWLNAASWWTGSCNEKNM